MLRISVAVGRESPLWLRAYRTFVRRSFPAQVGFQCWDAWSGNGMKVGQKFHCRSYSRTYPLRPLRRGVEIQFRVGSPLIGARTLGAPALPSVRLKPQKEPIQYSYEYLVPPISGAKLLLFTLEFRL